MFKRVATDSWGVSVASFVIALFLAGLVGPSIRALALRPPGDTTEQRACNVDTDAPCETVDGIGDTSILEACVEVLEDAILNGLADTGLDTSEQDVQDFVDEQAEGILSDAAEDGSTITFVDFDFDFDRGAGGLITVINVKWIDHLVILLPENPGMMLMLHEQGHKRIHEQLARLADREFRRLCQQFLGTATPNAVVEAAFNAKASELLTIGEAADKLFDAATAHGTMGGMGQVGLAQVSFVAVAIFGALPPC